MTAKRAGTWAAGFGLGAVVYGCLTDWLGVGPCGGDGLPFLLLMFPLALVGVVFALTAVVKFVTHGPEPIVANGPYEEIVIRPQH